MKLPKLEKPEKYAGLYAIDFEGQSAVGYTADEIAEILEGERFKDCKVYKIHRAYPDGRLELKGVRREIFQLEAGMFFYSTDSNNARDDYKRLVKIGIEKDVPCRAKIQLARFNDDKFATALIYPAEYDDEMSAWLLENKYKTVGEMQGGIEAASGYYSAKPMILAKHQLWPSTAIESRTGEELLASTKVAIQR